MTTEAEAVWYRRPDSWQFIFFLLILASANLSIAVSQISMGFCLAILLYKWFVRGERPPRTGLEKPALALALWALVMIPFSFDPPESLVFYRRFFLFTALWVGASLATSERRRYVMLAAVLVGAVLVSLWCESQILQRSGGLFTTRFMGASNSLTSGALLMMAVLIGLSFLAIQGYGRKWRILITAAVLLIALAMFQTMTRSAIMGFVAGVGAMILLARPRVFLIFLLIMVVLVAGTYSFGEQMFSDRFWGRISPDTLLNTDSGFGPRIEMWRGGWEMFKAHPLTGVGDCDLNDVAPLYYGDENSNYFGHMHSNLVMLAVIWGLPGFVLAHWFTLLPLVILARRWRSLASGVGLGEKAPAQKAWVLGATGVIVGFYVAGFTEWYFGDAEAMSLYLAIIGIGLGQSSPTE